MRLEKTKELARLTCNLIRHLLGKKSWNVYNTANIEKVRRDEAIARAEEAAREEKQQEEDAARRLAILRGEIPPPLAIEEAPKDVNNSTKRSRDERDSQYGEGRVSKRLRKKAGENDTDFEMRLAERQTGEKDQSRQLVLHDSSKNRPITDHAGNISLFQPPSKSVSTTRVEKHPDVESDAARKKQEQEDQYTLRFSNAAGRGADVINGKAWYQTSKNLGADALDVVEEVGKDVWGNEDPLRKSREAKRVVDNDPLAFMKRGAAQVRQVEKERRKWKQEKEREIMELEDEDRRRRKQRRRGERERRHRRDINDDNLENFTLDDGDADEKANGEKRHRHGSRGDRYGERRHKHRREDDEDSRHLRRDSDRYDEERHRHRHRRRDE